MIALLGQKQSQIDGIIDYCQHLEKALARQEYVLEQRFVPWSKTGWIKSLFWLWKESDQWQSQWVIVQFAAFGWSKRALPILFLVVLCLLRVRNVHLAVMFHEVQGYPGNTVNYRIRRIIQIWTIQKAIDWADKSIFNVSLEQLSWLSIPLSKGAFIPVGSNIPELNKDSQPSRKKEDKKSIAIFGMTSVEITFQEVKAIAYAITQAAKEIANLRLVTFGRGSTEAEKYLRESLENVDVEIEVLGLLEPEEITKCLSESDVQLYVRDEISTRRTTAIAGIACGIPIVAYEGKETAHPLPEAGVLLVPQGDYEALAEALIRVLKDDQLWLDLHQRNIEAYQKYFSWDMIAKRFIEELTDE